MREQKHKEKAEIKMDEASVIQNGKVLSKVDSPCVFPAADHDRIKDYRNYIDYYLNIIRRMNLFVLSLLINKSMGIQNSMYL